MRVWIVKARCQSFDVHYLVAALDIEFFDFRAAVPDLTTDRGNFASRAADALGITVGSRESAIIKLIASTRWLDTGAETV
jgi:hypothetical protein